MPETDREHLLIPTPEELVLVLESMRSSIVRASHRGVPQSEFAGVRHENADRLLATNPHVASQLQRSSRNIVQLAASGDFTLGDSYLFGAKDVLELLSITTTYSKLPQL